MVEKSFCGTSPCFFLGANTPRGFVSLFSELYDGEKGWRLYIIKGGAGTGKSTLMKTIAREADKRGLFCERIFCSSDPDSLDGVIIPGLKISIADGTAPHVLEPKFPGVCEKTVDLGEFRNDTVLRESREEIISLTLENSAEHKKCVGFLRAASLAERDNRLVLSRGLDTVKLTKFADSLADSILTAHADEIPTVSRRLLSAVTPKGTTVFADSIGVYCENRIILEDMYGLCAPVILKILSLRAAQAGLNRVECPGVISSTDALEHLLIPQLGTAVLTSDKYHSFLPNGGKTVRCMRFCRGEVLREHRNRISFNNKAKDEFLAEAVEKLKRAKTVHDELEKYYINAMDFNAVEQKTQRLVEEIFE